MLLTKEILVKINSKNSRYSRFLNRKLNIGDLVYIDIKFFKKNARIRVDVMCDICKKISNVSYSSYNNSCDYGFNTCVKCKDVKGKKTNLDKYGVEIFNNRDKAKETCINKYGCDNFTNRDKAKETCINKYGVDNVSKSDIIKKKKEEVNLKNWGVSNVFQSEEIKEKIKITNLEKYGVEHNSQSDNIKEKKVKTCLNNLGVEYPTQSEETIKKIKENNLEKYGVDWYTKTGKYISDVKKTNVEKYGSEWYMNSDNFKEKSIITNIKKYGCIYPIQNKKIFEKSIKSAYKKYKFNDLYYQGTYELHFIMFCIEKNINIKKGVIVKYIFNDRECVYYPDFYLPDYNLICEIKSDYTYNLHLERNLAKREYTIKNGYNFEFIINKDYSKILDIITHL